MEPKLEVGMDVEMDVETIAEMNMEVGIKIGTQFGDPLRHMMGTFVPNEIVRMLYKSMFGVKGRKIVVSLDDKEGLDSTVLDILDRLRAVSSTVHAELWSLLCAEYDFVLVTPTTIPITIIRKLRQRIPLKELQLIESLEISHFTVSPLVLSQCSLKDVQITPGWFPFVHADYQNCTPYMQSLLKRVDNFFSVVGGDVAQVIQDDMNHCVHLMYRSFQNLRILKIGLDALDCVPFYWRHTFSQRLSIVTGRQQGDGNTWTPNRFVTILNSLKILKGIEQMHIQIFWVDLLHVMIDIEMEDLEEVLNDLKDLILDKLREEVPAKDISVLKPCSI